MQKLEKSFRKHFYYEIGDVVWIEENPEITEKKMALKLGGIAKSRPYLIVYGEGTNKFPYIGCPITTNVDDNVFELKQNILNADNKEVSVILSQIRVIDTSKIREYKYTIMDSTLNGIKIKLAEMLSIYQRKQDNTILKKEEMDISIFNRGQVWRVEENSQLVELKNKFNTNDLLYDKYLVLNSSDNLYQTIQCVPIVSDNTMNDIDCIEFKNQYNHTEYILVNRITSINRSYMKRYMYTFSNSIISLVDEKLSEVLGLLIDSINIFNNDNDMNKLDNTPNGNNINTLDILRKRRSLWTKDMAKKYLSDLKQYTYKEMSYMYNIKESSIKRTGCSLRVKFKL